MVSLLFIEATYMSPCEVCLGFFQYFSSPINHFYLLSIADILLVLQLAIVLSGIPGHCAILLWMQKYAEEV